LKKFSSINIVGKGAVALAINAKIVGKDSVIKIAGVPHVQVYRI